MPLFVAVAVIIILMLMFGTGAALQPRRPDKTRPARIVTDSPQPSDVVEASAAQPEAKTDDAEKAEEAVEAENSVDPPVQAQPIPPAPSPPPAPPHLPAPSQPILISPAPSVTTPRPARRSRIPLVIAGLVVIALITMVVWYLNPLPLPRQANHAAVSEPLPADPCTPPGSKAHWIEAFVRAGCYKNWMMEEPPIRLSGAEVDGVYYTRHQYIQVYYSPGVAAWLDNRRRSELADGSMIVALEYATGDGRPGELQRILSRVKQRDGSYDGWFWHTTPLLDDQPARGRFGEPSCLACHSSADNTELVFLDGHNEYENPPPDDWKPHRSLRWPQPPPPQVTRRLPQPLSAPDRGFLDYFGLPGITIDEVVPFPDKSHDHVAAVRDPQHFVSANQCMGCHNAGQLLSGTRPAMWYPNPEEDDDPAAVYRDYSPYGEWSASMNGLSSRDPVWHAQVESERLLRPQLADFTDDTCFSCHAPMAGRQLRADSGDPDKLFTIDLFYALADEPGGKYGALARDGVSCMVCHAMSAEDLGVDPAFAAGSAHEHKHPDELMTYSALFKLGKLLGGPYRDSKMNAATMRRAIGMNGAYTDHTGESRLCGSCHTVIVPALPVGYQGTDPHNDPQIRIAYEQTTYWEWRNSVFQNEREPKGLLPIPCQTCHMTPHRKTRIANIESDRFPPLGTRLADEQLHLREQNPLWRHTLMGINLPVYKMFQQFPRILGAQLHDPGVVQALTLNPMLNAEDWMRAFAEQKVVHLEILSAEPIGDQLEINVQVSNLAGHKMPSGAGFRRAFVELRVLNDQGRTLWVSGATDAYGAIVGGDGQPLRSEFTRNPSQSQPHYQQINHQDQVQIYETRALDSEGRLQSTVLGIYREYKDNRLLPIGWDPTGPNTFATAPKLPAPPNRRNPGNIKRSDDGRALGRRNTYCYDGYDPDYCEPERTRNGQDHFSYRIFLEQIEGWARVEARLYYQTIPPYYLKERFRLGQSNGEYGRDTKRLIYLASHLNLADSAVAGWKMRLGPVAGMDKGEPARPGLSLEQALERVKIPNRY